MGRGENASRRNRAEERSVGKEGRIEGGRDVRKGTINNSPALNRS